MWLGVPVCRKKWRRSVEKPGKCDCAELTDLYNNLRFMTIPTTALVTLLFILVAALVNHWLKEAAKNRREAANAVAARAASEATTKLAFVVFMTQWRTEIEMGLPPEKQGFYPPNIHVAAYDAKISVFQSELKKVESLFTGNLEFIRLAGCVNGLKTNDWQKCHPNERKILLDALDGLVDFIQKNRQP